MIFEMNNSYPSVIWWFLSGLTTTKIRDLSQVLTYRVFSIISVLILFLNQTTYWNKGLSLNTKVFQIWVISLFFDSFSYLIVFSFSLNFRPIHGFIFAWYFIASPSSVCLHAPFPPKNIYAPVVCAIVT